MSFGWLKNSLPRGLYGRAALILVLPVVVLQLVVSIAFIQRHFEDVTTQMTRTLLRELDLVFTALDAAETPQQALDDMAVVMETLNLKVSFEAPPPRDRLRWYDFSGRV